MIYIVITYLIFEALFDRYAILGTTNADIVYNVINYSFVGAITLHEGIRDKNYRYFYFLITALFIYYAIGHVICWGMNYTLYRAEIEHEGSVPIYSFILIGIFLFFYLYKFRPWQKVF